MGVEEGVGVIVGFGEGVTVGVGLGVGVGVSVMVGVASFSTPRVWGFLLEDNAHMLKGIPVIKTPKKKYFHKILIFETKL